MLKRCKSVFVSSLLFTACGLSTSAQAFVGFNVTIDSPPPPIPANVVVIAPKGYEECYITQGFWEGNVWIPAHQECVYSGASGPSVWVSGYWGCLSAGRGGHCGRWKWYGNHWSSAPYRGRNYMNHGHYNRNNHGHHDNFHPHATEHRHQEMTIRHNEISQHYTHGHDVHGQGGEHHHR